MASEMTSTTSLLRPKRQRVSPPNTCHLSPHHPRKAHSSLTIRRHQKKQDAINNDKAPSSLMCTAGSGLVTRSKKDILGARDDDAGLQCKSSSLTMRTKPPKPDRVSESVADVEILTHGEDGVVLGSITKTDPQCWVVAATMTPSTTTNSLLNPLPSQHSVSRPALKMDFDEKDQQHHDVIHQQEHHHHDCYCCGKGNLSMKPPSLLDSLQRVEKNNAPSSIITMEEEVEWTSSTSSTFSSCASQNNNAFGEQPAEEEEEGLDHSSLGEFYPT